MRLKDINLKRIVFFAFIALGATTLDAQQIKGIVVADDGPLPGATISIDSLKQGTITNLDGLFSLQVGKPGTYEIKINYIGQKEKRLKVNVKPGINDLATILLASNELVLGEVVVSGTMAPSQAKAYNIKRNSLAMLDVLASDAMGKLPDRNAAEAVQRIQGVAVARYHGEADQATVRGTPFAWTSTLFNGSRLPSSNVGGNRSSVLDAIPSELIQYVQVAKAITPDMEGDAIGGSINFITRTAPLGRKLGGSLAGGYNNFSNNGTYNGSVVYSDRFLNGKLGVILVGAIWDRQWGSDAFDVAYNTTKTGNERNSINNVMLKRYMGKRQTYGLNAGLEYKFNNEHKIYFRGLYDKFNDIRPVYESYVNYVKDSSKNLNYQYNYRYSHYQTKLSGGELGGEHQLTSKLNLDWSASNYTSNYFLDTPSTTTQKGLPIATFYQKINGGFSNTSDDGLTYWNFDGGKAGNPLSFDAGLTNPSEVMDPTKLTLASLTIMQLDNKEQDKVFQANIKFEASPKLRFKMGAKFRTKDRHSMYGSRFTYAGKGGSTLSELQTEKFPQGNGYFNGLEGNHDQYIMNPLTKDQLFDLFTPQYLTSHNLVDVSSATNNATSIYDATENVYAAYAMATYEWTDKLTMTGGVRNEYTTTRLDGTKAKTDAAETTLSPSRIKNDYNALLPMLHLKYALGEKTNLRAAYTRTFVRGNFGDMRPGESINTTGAIPSITRGNADLKPTFANNFDLMGEHYFENVGLISASVFYKSIKDVIFSNQSQFSDGGIVYALTEAKNLEGANLFGFEVGVNRRFDFLNGLWSGFGMEVNYTFISSEVKVPRQIKNTASGVVTTTMDKSTLPDQSKHLGNVILFYEKGKLMLRLAGNYRGESVASINQNQGKEFYVWTDKNFTLDASATYSFSKKIKTFIELNNLTNEPLKQYMGDKRRLTSYEWYGSKGQIGFRFDIF